MKKFFVVMGVVALSLAAVGCNSEKKAQTSGVPAEVENIDLKKYGVKKDAELDKVSYTVGANIGLQMRFGMTDFGFDNTLFMKYMLEMFERGEIDQEAMAKDQQRSMEFQYSRFLPYAQAKRQREYSDRPDTLPALPAIFNDEFTKTEMTGIVGRMMGASLIDLKDDIDINWVVEGIREAQKVSSEENAFKELRMTQEEMATEMMNLQMEMRRRAMEEHARKAEENAAASAKWLAEVEMMEGVQKTESGLLYRIDREGSDVKATADTDVVEVNYEGKTRDGKIFDSSYERGESIEFALNRVIKGWTEGMKLVGEGGQITLWIPAEIAYGERGAGENIGPNEALEFKVELIKVTR